MPCLPTTPQTSTRRVQIGKIHRAQLFPRQGEGGGQKRREEGIREGERRETEREAVGER